MNFKTKTEPNPEPVSHFPEDSILMLLESRRGEREAQAYVKKRRQREKQSQEGIHP